MLRYIGYFIAWVLRIFLVVSSLIYLYNGYFFGALLLLLAFGFALIPLIIRYVYNVKLHWLYDVLFSFLIAGHMVGFVGVYEISLIYDDFVHICGSFIIALIGFSLAYSYDTANKIRITVPIIALFTILWTIGLGAIWEIIEFIWDNVILISAEYGFAQDSLLDTMIDLSWDLISGIVASLIMIAFVRKADKGTIKRVFQPFVNLIKRKPENI